MIYRQEYRGGVWVDLEQPTEEEVHQITQEFSISRQIEKEILSPTPSPLVAADGGATLLVLHFPSHNAEDGDADNQEIDFIVGSDFIVTVRYEVVAPLYHLKKLLETQALVSGKDSLTTDALLEVLFAHLYASVRDHTNHIASHLERVERGMFDHHERETVRSISIVSREFLHAEAALANQEESLVRFFKTLVERGMFDPSFAERAERILAERTQVARLITTLRAVATELRETNNALLSAKQNEVIKILTVVSFIFLPLALIAKIFAMKAKDMPFVDAPNGFWIIIGIMFIVALLLTLFVSRKHWI
jgi:magnesium transporter